MGRGIGVCCILLGILCLLGGAGLVVHNRWEANEAGKISQSMLQEVQEQILKNEEITEETEIIDTEESTGNTEVTGTEEVADEPSREMVTIPVEGYECIGILSIPAIGLEWPILTDWDYVKLKKAPCLYYGNYYEPDFVIAAHYYPTHFGGLSKLQAGDVVLFTNINGETYSYEVVLLETLPKKATKEMIASGFDLTLYTCTADGVNRVTVRCRKIQDM